MTYRIHTLSLLTCCVAGAILISGCSDSDNSTMMAQNDDLVMATLDEAALEQIEGIYEQRGYGNLYVYENNRTIFYSVTENTCFEIARFPGLAGLAPEEVEQTRYQLQGDQLSLLFPADVFVRRLDRLDALPERCDERVARDAQGVFDYTWETFDEYYAFFDLHGADWSAQYANLLPRVGEATDDDALFSLLADLVSPLDDGHVFVSSDTQGFSPVTPSRAQVQLLERFEAQSEITEIGVYVDTVLQQLFDTISSLMDEGSIRNEGPLIWATANAGSIGYLYIEGMRGYVLDDDGDSRNNVTAMEDLAAADAAMDRVMGDLAETSRLIIDVRINGGGLDAIGLEIARRFVSERQLVLTKTARGRDFESQAVEAFLEPLETGAYLNPVTLIIGENSESATEIFVIAMSQLPQVTLLGENTAGNLSDILQKPLPNGWAIGLSNEVYLDAAGVGYEGIGVSPDIEVPVFELDNIEAGVDPAIERALSMQ